MRQFIFTTLFLGLLIILSSCSSSLKPVMNVPSIPKPDLSTVNTHGSGLAEGRFAELFVADFTDARESEIVASLKGIDSKFLGSASEKVHARVEDFLREKGFTLNDDAPLVLLGQVKKWSADITAGVPATVEAKAAISIEVRDPANRRIYAGTYEGVATLKEPGVGTEEISKALGVAMSESLREVLADKQLLDLLTSF